MAAPTAAHSSSPAYRVASAVILDAATAVFAEQGFDRANMDAIAARGGITKPTLYARFGSKEGLFQAAVAREYELRKTRLFEAYGSDTQEPFRDRLHLWCAAYFDVVRDRPEAFLLISEGERHPEAAAVIRRANQEIVDRIADLVLQVSGRPAHRGAHVVAAMISGIFNACAREALSTPETDIDAAAALAESFLYAALRGLDPALIEALG